MRPVLYKAGLDPVGLLDSDGKTLIDSAGNTLLASGDWYSQMSFSNFGIGALTDCISCEVTEERNGGYELEMVYPFTGVHFNDLETRRIILAKPNYADDPQPFRIYQITTPINGVVSVYARHIVYDLEGVPAGFCDVTSASAACSSLQNDTGIPHPFTITTDISSSAEFAVNYPSSVWSWFGGKEGSLLDIYGGEWHYDQYTATLKAARGQDRGVVIRYGHNLLDLEQEANIADMYTGVLPFWKNDTIGELVTAGIVDADGMFGFRRILTLDMSMDFNNKPTPLELVNKARTYMRSNNVGSPVVNITLDFAQTNERVDLCDTVTVLFEKMGITATAKCIKTVWNVLKDRYSSFQFGDAKTTIADTIVDLQKAVNRR